MIGLLTGHCHLKGHLFELGMMDSPGVTDTNRHLGHYFLKSGDFADISVSTILHFVQSMGLLNA
jgi:hypothetical protein